MQSSVLALHIDGPEDQPFGWNAILPEASVQCHAGTQVCQDLKSDPSVHKSQHLEAMSPKILH